MSKKALYFGLSVALLASTVVGVFAPNALAAGTLICTPSGQTVTSGQLVSFSATYFGTGTFPTGSFTWTAVGGSPASGTGSTFWTQFFTTNTNEVRVVTVTDGYQTSSCTVTVYGMSTTPTPTPTPIPTLSLSANPGSTWNSVANTTLTWNSANMSNCTAIAYPANNQWSGAVNPNGSKMIYSLNSNTTFVIDCYSPLHVQRLAYFTANNSGPNPTPTPAIQYLTGTLSTTFAQIGYTTNYAITVNGNTIPLYIAANASITDSLGRPTNIQGLVSGMSVQVAGNPNLYNSTVWDISSVQVLPASSQGLTLSIAARNVSRGQTGEYNSVGVRGGDTVTFILRVTPRSGNATNVVFTDYLPAGFTYINSSTTLNGVVIGDGITTTGVNIGAVGLNQTATVRFSARMNTLSVPNAGVVTVYNTAQARADGTGTVSAQVRLNLGNALFATVSGIQTGPADSLFLALAIATLVTAMYAGYARTERFNRHMATQEIARLTGKHLNFSR